MREDSGPPPGDGSRPPERAFWDREVLCPTHSSWLEAMPVRLRVNRRIDPSSPCWPLDAFVRLTRGRTFERALSVGCGTGPLERDLLRRGLCRAVDAFDGSLQSLALARRQAKADGLAAGIRYFAADFNRVRLPERRYDLVLFHQSLHHVARLERIYAEVLGALTDDGLLYLDEYVGPSRTAWTPERLRPIEEAYRTIPAECRRRERVPAPIQEDDPSEAVRSGEILRLLPVGFSVLARRDLGGHLLSVLYPLVDWAKAPDDLIERLLDLEDEGLSAGVEPFYAVVVAAPRTDRSRAASRRRYRLRELAWSTVPRLRRVLGLDGLA